MRGLGSPSLLHRNILPPFVICKRKKFLLVPSRFIWKYSIVYLCLCLRIFLYSDTHYVSKYNLSGRTSKMEYVIICFAAFNYHPRPFIWNIYLASSISFFAFNSNFLSWPNTLGQLKSFAICMILTIYREYPQMFFLRLFWWTSMACLS